MLTNRNNRVLYTGVTNDLYRRIYEHKHKLIDGFTKKYRVFKLVFFEFTPDVNSAITREKEIKGWTRQKKNALVETMNPEWNDLSDNWKA
jgi:putative endonuclease